MTGLKLWMLFLLLHGSNGVEYGVINDRNQEVSVVFYGFHLLAENEPFESQSYLNDASVTELGPKWLEDSTHDELFKELCREFEGELVTSVHINNDNDSSVVIRVAPGSSKKSVYMERYLNEIAIRVVRVVEAHFKIKCHPVPFDPEEIDEDSDEEDESDEGFIPPVPVLPPEGRQHIYYLDTAL